MNYPHFPRLAFDFQPADYYWDCEPNEIITTFEAPQNVVPDFNSKEYIEQRAEWLFEVEQLEARAPMIERLRKKLSAHLAAPPSLPALRAYFAPRH